MRAYTLLLGVLGTSLLAGCFHKGSADGGGTGGLRTFPEAQTAANELFGRVNSVYEGEGKTLPENLPSGTVTYVGMLEGSPIGGLGDNPPEISYYADLTLTVDFDASSDHITGTVGNFVTNYPGFENPEGTVDLDGYIYVSPDDTIRVENLLPVSLVGDGVTADYYMGANGRFGGLDGAVMLGNQATDFTWTSGPSTGSTSFSDGPFGAERQ